MPEVKNIPVNCLYPHPDNPRKDLGDLTELAENIKTNGIFQNLMVVPVADVEPVLKEHLAAINRAHRAEDVPNGEAYVVIIGHRRLAAAKAAGLTEVPCVVVSLTPAEQIATMLEENMHRSDLTVYEKTRGFQMMLDLGETVESIVKKRGFKESTVRRHLKFTVFDDKTFRDAADKQISMDALTEVAKIENPKKRDEVLSSYGSNNFKWNLSDAISKQKTKKNRPAAKKEILAYATEVKRIDYGRYEYVMTVQFDNYTPGSATPENATAGEFVVNFGDTSAVVYKKRKKAPAQKKSKKELEREAEIRQRESVLSELTETAYNLRRDFVNGLAVSKTDYTKLMKHAGRALVVSNMQYCGGDFTRNFAVQIGVETPDSYMPDEFCKRLLNATVEYAAPDKPVIAAIYAAYSDKKSKGYWRKQYDGTILHTPNSSLDYLYDFLCDFGYELSDAELALKDGTHPFLETEKAASNAPNTESGVSV